MDIVYYVCVGIKYTLCIVGLEPWIRVGDGAKIMWYGTPLI